jgi:hypothetical protein
MLAAQVTLSRDRLVGWVSNSRAAPVLIINRSIRQASDGARVDLEATRVETSICVL